MAWMRQKPESEVEPAKQITKEAPRVKERKPEREIRMEQMLNIGQSVQIKGELSGNEDLTIEGMVDGKIMLKDHNLTIGKNGRINADVHAKTVIIVGQVMGNVTADDKVELAATGSVHGDIRAPRVAIADGARFKGSIEMEGTGAASGTKQSSKTSGISAAVAQEMPRSASSAIG